MAYIALKAIPKLQGRAFQKGDIIDLKLRNTDILISGGYIAPYVDAQPLTPPGEEQETGGGHINMTAFMIEMERFKENTIEQAIECVREIKDQDILKAIYEHDERPEVKESIEKRLWDMEKEAETKSTAAAMQALNVEKLGKAVQKCTDIGVLKLILETEERKTAREAVQVRIMELTKGE